MPSDERPTADDSPISPSSDVRGTTGCDGALVPETSARRRTRPLTIVCHLLVEPAVEGRLVGHVEIVNTGDTVAVTSVAELIEVIARCARLELTD